LAVRVVVVHILMIFKAKVAVVVAILIPIFPSLDLGVGFQEEAQASGRRALEEGAMAQVVAVATEPQAPQAQSLSLSGNPTHTTPWQTAKSQT
jgi:hypothetical protein